MSLGSKILISTDKPILDIHDKWLPPGTYTYKINSLTENSTIKGTIVSGRKTGDYEFKYFTTIKMMAKMQSILLRRTNLKLDMTSYPSPSNSPYITPKTFADGASSHTFSPTNYVQCTICLEKCTNKLSCGHYFHQKCIDKWKKRSPLCPVCRSPLTAAAKK